MTPPSVPTEKINATDEESKGICDRCKKPIYVYVGCAWHSKDEKVWHEVCSYQSQIEELQTKLEAAHKAGQRSEAKWWYDEFVWPWRADDLDAFDKGEARLAALRATPAAPETESVPMGTCDLVARPHQQNHCGKAWRPLPEAKK